WSEGASSALWPSTPTTSFFFVQVKPELEKQTNRKYPVYNTIVYRSQLVGGTNFLIKVSIQCKIDECVHLLVFRSLPCNGMETTLTSYQTGKTTEDPLEPF
uniref:Cystatin domain-containing protein n=1 Tax=Pelusios castaneus TaxID=367368 RepID=A0A8C8RH72_9SAUR